MKKSIMTLIKGAEKITVKIMAANVKGLSYLYILKENRIYQCWDTAKMARIFMKLYDRGFTEVTE